MTKVIIKNARLSYANIFEKSSIDDNTPKYSTALLIDKSDTNTINAIKHAINKAIEEGKNSKWGGKIPGNLKTPLRDGDEERPDDPNYKDKFFFNASTTRKPQVLDVDKSLVPDPEDGAYSDVVYSGCYAHVSINFYPFEARGNKGVAAGLGNVMKAGDGEPLAGGSTAEEDFADIEASEVDYDWL